jgi:trigger factor
MKVTEGKSKGLNKEYKAVIAAADFEKEVDARLEKIAQTTKIQGFRPGKAPKSMVKQKYRASVLGEVLDDMLRHGADEIIADKKLRPAVTPELKLTTFKDGEDIEFEVSVEVLPEIKTGDFSKISLEKPMSEVPAEEVEKAIRYVAESRRDQVKVEEDRPTKKGDIAVIDFVGSVDGVEFQGGKGSAYPLELGSGSFIPGFEDQLIGKKVGDKVNVNVTFPETYHAKDLAGKAALFVVDIKELREPKEVVIDDAFAKSLGEDSLDSLRAKVVERIKADYEKASRLKLKRALLDVLDKEYTFEVPQKLVDAEYDGIVKQYEYAKQHNQLDESEKARDEKDLLAEYKEIALRRVKLGLLLSEVGNEAELKILPEDLNKAIMAEAQKYPGQEKVVFDYYLKNKQAVEALKAPVFEEKIVDHILSKVQLKEVIVPVEQLYSFDDDEKPASKPTKKSKK